MIVDPFGPSNSKPWFEPLTVMWKITWSPTFRVFGAGEMVMEKFCTVTSNVFAVGGTPVSSDMGMKVGSVDPLSITDAYAKIC